LRALAESILRNPQRALRPLESRRVINH
jgi:hypothetical protein